MHASPSPVEWVLAAVSVVLVLGVIGFMLYEALGQADEPPLIELRVERVERAAGRYVAVISAENRGGTTAAGLSIEGRLLRDGETVEQAAVTLDYVPEGARRRAGLYFSHDPAAYQLELQPKGYDYP